MNSPKPRKTKKERDAENDAAFEKFVKEANLVEIAPRDTPQGLMRVFAYTSSRKKETSP